MASRVPHLAVTAADAEMVQGLRAKADRPLSLPVEIAEDHVEETVATEEATDAAACLVAALHHQP
jgi:hypothetical protein